MQAFARKSNPGRRIVVATAEGYREARQEISLDEGEVQVMRLELEPLPEETPSAASEGSSVSPWVWVGFGTGALGLTIGAITGGVAAAKSSSLDDQCQDKIGPPERQSDLDSLNATAHTSTAFFIIGAVGVTVRVVSLFVLSPDEDDESSERTATLHLQAAPSGGVLSGRF